MNKIFFYQEDGYVKKRMTTVEQEKKIKLTLKMSVKFEVMRPFHVPWPRMKSGSQALAGGRIYWTQLSHM